MKKNAFTVVELVVTFVLTATIAIFLFQIIIVLKNLYISYGMKTELLNKQSIISNKINESFKNKSLINVTKCGSYCLNFIYDDQTINKFFINENELSIEFGDYKTVLPTGSRFGDMKVDIYISPVFNNDKNDSILTINVPIYNDSVKDENIGINVLYQYNSVTTNITSILFENNTSQYGAIVLKGSNEVQSCSNKVYEDPGYNLYDVNGNILFDTSLVTIINPFTNMNNPYNLGKYEYKYYLKDSNNNIIDTKIRTVNIIDEC